MVLVLVGVQDVGPVPVEQRGDARNEAFLVRAVNQQYGRVFHAAFSLNQDWTASLTASAMNPTARKRRLPGRLVSQQVP